MAIDTNADFTPTIPDSGVVPVKSPYNPTGSFKFWAQKVLPLVYDDSLSYYEVLCKVVNYLNNVIQNVDNLNDSVNSTNQSFETLKGYVNTTKDTLINTYNELQDYVNTYFDNLDVQEEINKKLDAMADSGELTNLLAPFIPDLVTQWLNNHVTPTSPIIDNTLSISGAGADAKVTGDKITALKEDISTVKDDLQDFTFTKIGKNINNAGYEDGWITETGADTSAASYEAVAFRSNGYIPVIGGSTIYWWGKLSDGTALGANAVIVEYDSDKNIIGGARHPFNKYGTTADNQAFTTSSNATYVRIAVYQGVKDKETIQIALYYSGDEQKSYVPYSKETVVNYYEIYDSNERSADEIIDSKIAAIKEDISTVKDGLQDFTFTKSGKNINNAGYEGGYITTTGADTSGASYEAAAFRSNGYIPVIGGSTIYWWGKLSDGTALGANAVIVEYDSDKNIIGARHPFNKYGTTADNQAFTTSSNAAYVRIALFQGVEDKETIQIALYYSGDEQTSYVPYSKETVVNYYEIYDSNNRSADEIIDSKIAAIGFTPLYDYEEITVTGESGALMSNGKITQTTDVTRYTIPVSKGDRYVVSARHGYAYRAFLVLDADSKILSYYPSTISGTAIHRNVQVDIEQDGYLVLQDVYRFMPILGKVTKYSMGDNLYQKSIYWNGDSVCAGAGGTSFADQISLFHAMPETMDAVSGTRLTTRSGVTNSIYERVIAMDTSADYDYIGIEGGYNDYFSSVSIGSLMANYTDNPDTTTVIGAVEGICKHIRTNFPNSKFFFVLGHRPITVGQYETVVDTYWDAIITALNKWAVPFIDIRKEGSLMAYNNDWLSDYFGEGETMGTHPNKLGYKMFYNNLVESKMQSL